LQIACPQPTQALQAPLNKELTSARELSSGGSRGSGGSGGTNAQRLHLANPNRNLYIQVNVY